MGQVTVIVNGRSYRLKCGEGEEQRLVDLAEHVRQRIDDLSYEFGHAGDERLLLMAALMITDELWETKARLAALEAPSHPAPEDSTADDVSEPLPTLAASTALASTTAAPQAAREPASSRPALGPEPVAAVASAARPPGAATSPPQPATKPAPSGPFVQEPSLQRALRRSPQKTSKSATLEDRLAVVRETTNQDPRKTTAT